MPLKMIIKLLKNQREKGNLEGSLRRDSTNSEKAALKPKETYDTHK